jgi:hypothetical protein
MRLGGIDEALRSWRVAGKNCFKAPSPRVWLGGYLQGFKVLGLEATRLWEELLSGSEGYFKARGGLRGIPLPSFCGFKAQRLRGCWLGGYFQGFEVGSEATHLWEEYERNCAYRL